MAGLLFTVSLCKGFGEIVNILLEHGSNVDLQTKVLIFIFLSFSHFCLLWFVLLVNDVYVVVVVVDKMIFNFVFILFFNISSFLLLKNNKVWKWMCTYLDQCSNKKRKLIERDRENKMKEKWKRKNLAPYNLALSDKSPKIRKMRVFFAFSGRLLFEFSVNRFFFFHFSDPSPFLFFSFSKFLQKIKRNNGWEFKNFGWEGRSFSSGWVGWFEGVSHRRPTPRCCCCCWFQFWPKKRKNLSYFFSSLYFSFFSTLCSFLFLNMIFFLV